MRHIGCLVLICGVASSCSISAPGGDRSLSRAARSHVSVQRVNAEGGRAGASFAARGEDAGDGSGNAGNGGGSGNAGNGGGSGNAGNGDGSVAVCAACSGETRSVELPGETGPSTAPSPKPRNPEDAWIGLTSAEVTRAATGDRDGWGPKDVSYSGGPPRVTRRGGVWTLEWIPGGCSDFSAALTLGFVNGRVKRVELDRRHRHTGMECASRE